MAESIHGSGRMHLNRLLVCGLLAGGAWTLLSIALLALLGGDFLSALPSRRTDAPNTGLQLLLIGSNIAAGVWAMWLYAAIQPRFGPGLKTAVIAGVAWWTIASLQSAKWVALASVAPEAALAPLGATLLGCIASTLVGAWFYDKQ
jgi:hypothetical protein